MPRISALLGLLADVSSGQKNLFTLYLSMYIFSRAISNAVSDKLFVGESLNSTTISNLTANAEMGSALTDELPEEFYS